MGGLFLSPEATKKAVAYYRHSAEDKQENSVPIQRDHAQKFAAKHSIEVIHEEADEGKTGLLASRPGFERLFNDWITSEEAPEFDYVLVYDVSRWGRFQDQDEAAYYEFRCKQYGKQVVYITHGFPEEEHRLVSSLRTQIERYMAADYSKQLSEKVFYGSAKVAEQGFSAGGTAPYGMARVLLDEAGKELQILQKGEHKVIANQRVTFAPANDETSRTVQTVFQEFVEEWKTPEEIAAKLNEQGIRSAMGGTWNRGKILRLLSNETYTGTRIYNKTWSRLRQPQRSNPRSEWVVCPDAFEGLVSSETFQIAQERLYWQIKTRHKRGTNINRGVREAINAQLDTLLEQAGYGVDERWTIIRSFPLVLGATFYRDSIPHWCFVIPEELKRTGQLLGVATDVYERNVVKQAFLLPTKEFRLGNFLVFSKQDKCFRQYQLEEDATTETALELTKQLVAT